MTKVSNSNLMFSLKNSVKSGGEWLVRKQELDGSFKNCPFELCAYYKAPLMFSSCGIIVPGIRSLTYIKKNLQNEKGELCSGLEKTKYSRMQRNLANYMDGWVAIGSWRLGDYKFSESIVLKLKSQQYSVHGGIATGPEKWSGDLRFDLATAASCGRAFLLSGHRKEAFAAGDFLVEALNHQFNLNSGLNLCFDQNWTSMDYPDQSERSYYRLELKERGEKVWFPAFSCAFLCELFQISNKNDYLESAKTYFSTISETIEFKEGSLANGKSGWAAGLLAYITGDKKYLEAVKIIVPNVLARQREDGEFGPSPRSKSHGKKSSSDKIESTPPLPRRLETTAEFTTWITEYIRFYSMGLWDKHKK